MTVPSSTAAGSTPVTVLIPTRSRPDLLARALRAVWAQTYAGRITVLVIRDGGPEAGDVGILPRPVHPDRQFLHVVDNTSNPGSSAATRNVGLRLVDDPWVATCDDDDAWLPGRLAVQVADLSSHPRAMAAGGSLRVVTGRRRVVRRHPGCEVGMEDLLADRVIELHTSAMLYRTEALHEAGGWDETLPGSYAEDYDLLLKIARQSPIRVVRDVVADIYWAGQSYYFGRWTIIAEALTELLRRYPEFASVPRGRARIAGQVAFAHAARGDRAEARRWLASCWRDNPADPRGLLTAIVLSRAASADRVQAVLHAAGRGIC